MKIYNTFAALVDETSSDPEHGVFLSGFVDRADMERLKAFEMMQSSIEELLAKATKPERAAQFAQFALMVAAGMAQAADSPNGQTSQAALIAANNRHTFRAFAALYRALFALGFGSDEKINGGDVVDVVNGHWHTITHEMTRFQAVSEIMASAKNVVLSWTNRNLAFAVQDLKVQLVAVGVEFDGEA